MRDLDRRVNFYENIQYSQVRFLSKSRTSSNSYQLQSISKHSIQTVKRNFIMSILIWVISCFWMNSKKPNILKWKIKSILKNFSMNITVILIQKNMSDSTTNFKLNTSTMKDQLKKLLLRMFKKNLTILEYTSVTEQFFSLFD